MKGLLVPSCLAALIALAPSARGETLLDFADVTELSVTPRSETSGGEGTSRFTDDLALAGRKCFYFGTPPGVRVLYPWTVTTLWFPATDLTPYDRAVLDYVNVADEPACLSFHLGPSGKDCHSGKRRLANGGAGRIVMPVRFADPSAARAVKRLSITGSPGHFEFYLNRVSLLRAGEPLPPPVEMTDARRQALDRLRDEARAKIARIRAAQRETDLARQKAFREKFRTVAGGETMVGVATSMDQIRPLAMALEPNRPAVVDLRLARGETEAVQVYVMPRGDTALKDVSVSLSVEGFADADLTACVIGHLKCEGLVPYERGVVLPATNGFVRKTCPVGPGWYPDPILSFRKSCDIAPLVCQPFYVQVRARRDLAPGVRNGSLRVTAANAEAVELPVRVRVDSFVLPRESPLPLAISFGPMAWDRQPWMNETEGAAIAALRKSPESPCNVWKRHADEWCDFVAERYVMPSCIYHGQTPLPHAEKLAQYRREGRLGWYCLGYYPPVPSLDDAGIAKWKRKYLPVFRANYEQAKRLGILDRAYLYGCDELTKELHPRVAAAVAILKREFPEVPVSTTGVDDTFGGDGSDLGQMDWFIALVSRPHYDGNGAAIARARAAGKKVWWYFASCEKAPRANLFAEMPPSELRSLVGAQSWKMKTDGLLYFQTTIWNVAKPIPADTTPFLDWPTDPFPNGAELHSNGSPLYCGPDGIPVSSLHFEAFREGVEDYAYLKLLSEKLAESPDASWAEEAKRLLDCPLVRSPYDFDDTPARHYAWRNAIADLLERE